MTKTVALYGFSKLTRSQIEDSTAEIWTLNNAYERDVPMERVTRWYEIHPPKYARGTTHYNWLRRKHPFPIFMQRKYKSFPSSVEFPLSCIAGRLDGERLYFTNSIAIMLAHAIADEYERIELYGVNMDYGTEYAYQKACTEYMIGIAIGRGIDVYLPPNCMLLNAPIYGYDANFQRIDARIVQQHREHYTKRREDCDPSEPLYHFFDGAQAQCAFMLAKFAWDDTIVRHNVELQHGALVNDFQKITSDYNFSAGQVNILERNHETDSEIIEANARYRLTMYQLDGGLAAMNNMIRHLDIKPYSLDIEPSLK